MNLKSKILKVLFFFRYSSLRLVVKYFSPDANLLRLSLNSTAKHPYHYIPHEYERLMLTNDVRDDFSIRLSKDKFGFFEEVNIFVRGADRYLETIDTDLPTFFVNVLDLELLKKFRYPVLITADPTYRDIYLALDREKGPLRIIFLQSGAHPKKSGNNINEVLKQELPNFAMELFIQHKTFMPNIQCGSLVPSVIFSALISRKTNVFGWDQYLTQYSKNQTYLSTDLKLFDLFTYTDSFDPFARVATNLIAACYCYRLSHQENLNVKVHGCFSRMQYSHDLFRFLAPLIYEFETTTT